MLHTESSSSLPVIGNSKEKKLFQPSPSHSLTYAFLSTDTLDSDSPNVTSPVLAGKTAEPIILSRNLNHCPPYVTSRNDHLVKKLSQTLSDYCHLVKLVGSSPDGERMRDEMACLRQKALDIIVNCQNHLSLAFKTPSFPCSADSHCHKDMQKLEQTCRILVASIHMLDRELRLTRHLFRVFPLFCETEESKEGSNFIRTGVSLWKRQDQSSSCAWQPISISLTAKYWQERDSWQQLESEILMLHDLDLALHRDVVLGPIVDYLTLCPSDDKENASCFINADDASMPSNLHIHVDESNSHPSTRHACVVISVLIMLFIGGGVLIGVIFIIID